ncbi:MAG: hypothetical protein ABIZ70_11210 [Gemmatimonadales bacterium]
MSLIGVVLIVALAFPIISIVMSGPIGRRFGRRRGTSVRPAPLENEEMADLRRRLDQVEGEVDILHSLVTQLREENESLQRQIESGPSHSSGSR